MWPTFRDVTQNISIFYDLHDPRIRTPFHRKYLPSKCPPAGPSITRAWTFIFCFLSQSRIIQKKLHKAFLLRKSWTSKKTVWGESSDNSYIIHCARPWALWNYFIIFLDGSVGLGFGFWWSRVVRRVQSFQWESGNGLSSNVGTGRQLEIGNRVTWYASGFRSDVCGDPELPLYVVLTLDLMGRVRGPGAKKLHSIRLGSGLGWEI